MKKWTVFLIGFILGIVLTFVILFVIGVHTSKTSKTNNRVTIFEQPGECLSTNNFEVMQVIEDGCALAHEVTWNSILERYTSTDLLVLVINDNEEYYYDDQIIKVPKGKCMRQVGIYRYPTKMEIEKTVPIVKLMDK